MHKILDLNKKAENMSGCVRFDKGSGNFSNNYFLAALGEVANDIRGKHLGYAPVQGLAELRGEISKLENFVSKRKIAPDNILITQGALPGIFLILFHICKPGDEVLMNDVHFEGFDNLLNSLGVKGKLCDFENLESVKSAIGPKTKAILFNSPENPTGKIYSEGAVKNLQEISEGKNIWVISDEVNNQIVYGRNNQFNPGRRFISVNSFSKNYFLQGLRLGWLAGSTKIISELCDLQSSFQISVDVVAQLAAIKVLKARHSKYLNILKSRRNLMSKCLKENELQFLMPSGGTNFFVNINVPSEKFAEFLLREYGVATIPGIYFGEAGEGFLRLGFGSVTEKEIREGCKKIKLALNNFRAN